VRCVYQNHLKREIANTFIRGACPPQLATNPDVDQVAAELGEILLVAAASFKDASFEEEQEWRLVSLNAFLAYDPKRGFRTSGNSLVPYYKVALGPPTGADPNGDDVLPFDGFRIGPQRTKEDKEMIRDAFMYYCFYKRVHWETAAVSTVPYRTA
jgi:hypothetical protein